MCRICNVDYLDAVVVDGCYQRVVRVPYLCSGDRGCSLKLRVGLAIGQGGHRQRVCRICNVDYLDAVVAVCGDQRVVQVPYLCSGDRVRSLKLLIGLAVDQGGHRRRADRICNVDYLDAVCTLGGYQRVVRVSYLDGGYRCR